MKSICNTLYKYALLVALILAGSLSAMAQEDNVLVMESITAKAGEQAVLKVNMNNTASITGFQFDLYLPDGVSIAKDEYEDELISLSTARTTLARHSISWSTQPDGAMRVACTSLKNALFTGTEGEVATITLQLDADLEPDAYDITYKKIELTTPQLVQYKTAQMTSKLYIEEENPDPIVKLEIDGIIYELIRKAKIATVKGVSDGDIVNAEVKATIEYKGVTYTVDKIGDYAFDGCGHLSSVNLPNTITTIGEWAFVGCSGLSSIDLPDSLKELGNQAFFNCSSLTSITIPNSVTEIGANAFNWCYNLNYLKIGSSVVSMIDYSFAHGSNELTVIDVDSSNPLYSSIDGVVLSKDQSVLILCPQGKNGEYTIPNTVTRIEESAFRECNKLQSIIIPNSVKEIGYGAFSYCSGLTSMVIPNSIEVIEAQAFYECSISSITLPNSIMGINGQTFAYCSNLTSIIIPNSVEIVDDAAFSGCSNLSSVTIGSSVKRIGYNAFTDCAIKSIVIPNSVEIIDHEAFWRCSSLTSVTLGSSVSSIGSNAFAKCPNLENVYCYAENVPSTAEDAFAESYIEYTNLHVPDELATAYQSTEPWSEFKQMKSTSGSELPTLEPCAAPVIAFENGKITCTSETEGAECYKSMSTNMDTDENGEVTIRLTVTAYAVAEGYMKSENVTRTFTILPGDMNGDGELTIDDVTKLVNKVLKKSQE